MSLDAYDQTIGAPLANWTPREQPARTTLEGRLCRLEPLDIRHADALFEAYQAAKDGRDWTYLPVERSDDRALFKAYVATQSACADPLHYAIFDNVCDRPVGAAALMRIDPANGVIEIGHVNYSPLLQRRAAGTEAIYLLMRRVFDELGYRRLEWKCDSLNLSSRRAAVRYGFSFEGVFRQALVTKGRNRDTAWYAIIDGDWPAARQAIERWLAPGNFDEYGSQRRPLSSFRACADGEPIRGADA